MRREFDRGEGSPVVVIPGVQCRWEWMTPALEALATRCRAISYSLGPVHGAAAAAIERDAGELDAVLDRAGVSSATIAGVSLGGLIAVHYAATRPHRTRALVLVSTPSPSWTPSAGQARLIQRPWLSAPLLMAMTPFQFRREIAAAIRSRTARARFSLVQSMRVLTAFPLPHVMAARGRLGGELDLAPECGRITAPALVITGEPALDRVVPVASTREYLTLIPGARYAMMEGTGHLGIVTRPERFAEIVTSFAPST